MCASLFLGAAPVAPLVRLEWDGAVAVPPEERRWAEAIEAVGMRWPSEWARLRKPFPWTRPPEFIRLRFRAGGERDAYTCGEAEICFDLAAWVKAYGAYPVERDAEGRFDAEARIGRILDHEYTHLLTHAWQRSERLPLNSPYRRALWELFHEGFGNYRSLSSKWLPVGGRPSLAAQDALKRLVPVLQERLKKLEAMGIDPPGRAAATAADPAAPRSEEEAKLRDGLSAGAFDQKWGALPVAIWLALEARGDEVNLKPWADGGPGGILALIRKHAPALE